MTVVVVGAPGSGKSTVGRLVAAALGLGFADVDERIEDLAGKPIREIFVDEGEPYFRDLERDQTIAALAEDAVVSLGGGAVMTPAIRDALAGHTVVWLRVSAVQAARRIGVNASRPLLYGDVRTRLDQLLADREPVYASVATHTVDTNHADANAVAGLVLKSLDKEA